MSLGLHVVMTVCAILFLTGTATQAQAIVEKEGFHEQLKRNSSEEFQRTSDILSETKITLTGEGDINWMQVLRDANATLKKRRTNLRIVCEFSSASGAYFTDKLEKKIDTWDGTSLKASEVRAKLADMPLYMVLSEFRSQIGGNLLFYKDTLLLSNYISGD